jgi:alpha-galactosidase
VRSLKELSKLDDNGNRDPNNLPAMMRNLWKKKDAGQFKGMFSTTVPSHGVVMVRVTP